MGARSDFAATLGGAAQADITHAYQRSVEAALLPDTSRLEGVRI